jgi:hypothetical protein
MAPKKATKACDLQPGQQRLPVVKLEPQAEPTAWKELTKEQKDKMYRMLHDYKTRKGRATPQERYNACRTPEEKFAFWQKWNLKKSLDFAELEEEARAEDQEEEEAEAQWVSRFQVAGFENLKVDDDLLKLKLTKFEQRPHSDPDWREKGELEYRYVKETERTRQRNTRATTTTQKRTLTAKQLAAIEGQDEGTEEGVKQEEGEAPDAKRQRTGGQVEPTWKQMKSELGRLLRQGSKIAGDTQAVQCALAGKVGEHWLPIRANLEVKLQTFAQTLGVATGKHIGLGVEPHTPADESSLASLIAETRMHIECMAEVYKEVEALRR